MLVDACSPLLLVRPAVLFRLRFRLRLQLSLQNTAALLTPILSLNLVQRPGGSHLAAEQDEILANYKLGVMYRDGQFVPQDYAEAVKGFRMAVEWQIAEAQRDLGAMYENGHGVPQDDSEAVNWYREAAHKGDEKAQFDLGRMYANGTWVPQDMVEAYAWFSIAADGGYTNAVKRRDDAGGELSPEQLSKAQKRATKLLEKYGTENKWR